MGGECVVLVASPSVQFFVFASEVRSRISLALFFFPDVVYVGIGLVCFGCLFDY